jgi:hypothetical protein
LISSISLDELRAFAAQRLDVSGKLQLSLCITLSIFVYNQSLEKQDFAAATMVGASLFAVGKKSSRITRLPFEAEKLEETEVKL